MIPTIAAIATVPIKNMKNKGDDFSKFFPNLNFTKSGDNRNENKWHYNHL